MTNVFEVAYYDEGVLMVERYEAVTRMQARGCVVHRLKRQVDFEYVEDITAQYELERGECHE